LSFEDGLTMFKENSAYEKIFSQSTEWGGISDFEIGEHWDLEQRSPLRL
jgi:hypothetical protein